MSTPSQDTWSASEYNSVASFVYSEKNTAPVMSLLQPKGQDKIIDFGCGSGELDLQLANVVQLVVGLDSSQSMINKSEDNGVKYAYVADVQSLHRPQNETFLKNLLEKHGHFDAVFSSAALHWCNKDPAGVLESVKKVLKPEGRFVAEFGGWGNCIGIRSAIHLVLRQRGYDPVARDPWFFPSEDQYRALLTTAGFKVTHLSSSPRPTLITGALIDWIHLFLARSSFFQGIDPGEAESMMKEVEAICEPDMRDQFSDKWMVMYVRLRVSAVWNP